MDDPPLSKFGSKLGAHSGILELMDDLGSAMAEGEDMCMMGGGNPALIPEVAEVWRRRMRELLDDPEFDGMLVNYDPPSGNEKTLAALANLLRREYGWDVGPENIAVTTGGQTAFFLLFNMLAGEFSGGRHRRILFPLMPEYIGYANQGLDTGMFRALPPRIETLDEHTFKYHIDFDRLRIDDDVAALCVSRPTNPTGNVIGDSELDQLNRIAAERGVLLIIDNAYGAPFPGILFTDVHPTWNQNMILTMSLSKLGLPGTRTAFVVAAPPIIEAVSSMNAVLALSNNNVGQTIIRPFLESGEILDLSRRIVQPFYLEKSLQTQKWLLEALGDRIAFRWHISEGALFLWVHFPDLPISAAELYQRLKARQLLVIPGHYFFFGLNEPHPHADKCIRMTFSQPDAIVERGIGILADEIRALHATAHP